MDPANLGLAYRPFADLLARLEAAQPGRLRILDVGCGNGGFLALAQQRSHEVRGVEIDPTMARLIPASVRPHVTFLPIEQVADFGCAFDVVTFWDSFEHLAAPLDVLNSLNPHLAPDASVFLRVNNVHDVFNIATSIALAVAPPIGKRLLRMCFNLPQHHWNFSQSAMRGMLASAGWRITEHRVTETPISRLTSNRLARLFIGNAYLANKAIGAARSASTGSPGSNIAACRRDRWGVGQRLSTPSFPPEDGARSRLSVMPWPKAADRVALPVRAVDVAP